MEEPMIIHLHGRSEWATATPGHTVEYRERDVRFSIVFFLFSFGLIGGSDGVMDLLERWLIQTLVLASAFVGARVGAHALFATR